MSKNWAKWCVFSMVLIGCLTAPGAAVAQTSGSTCEPFGAFTVGGGSYIVQLGEYNSTANECMSVYGTSFSVTQSDINNPTNGAPGAYTSIYQGCHWGSCTKTSAMPVAVSGLARATTSWSTTQGAPGAWDATYDIWFNPTPTTNTQPTGAELMIVLNMTGGTQPAGSVVGHLSAGGASYTVWATRMNNCNYVAYRADTPVTGVTNLDIKPFISDAVQRGYIQRAWYLISVEAGFEIWQGGVGLATNSFAVNVTSNGK